MIGMGSCIFSIMLTKRQEKVYRFGPTCLVTFVVLMDSYGSRRRIIVSNLIAFQMNVSDP